MTVRTRVGTGTLESGKNEAKGPRTDFWVWKYKSLSSSHFSHLYTVPDGKKAEASNAAPPGRSSYSGVFCSCRTYVPTAWRSDWWSSHSLGYHNYFLLSSYDLSNTVAFTNRASIAVIKKPGIGSWENGAEQNVSRTSQTNKGDKSDNEERINEDYAAGSTDSAKAPDWKILAASMLQALFIVKSFTSFGMNVWFDTTVTDCNFFVDKLPPKIANVKTADV